MYRGGYAPSSVHETVAVEGVYGHYRRVAEQSSELYRIAYVLAYHGYYAYGGGLLVYHAYGTLVWYEA